MLASSTCNACAAYSASVFSLFIINSGWELITPTLSWSTSLVSSHPAPFGRYGDWKMLICGKNGPFGAIRFLQLTLQSVPTLCDLPSCDNKVDVKLTLRERLADDDDDLSDLPISLKVNLVETLTCNQ